MKKEKEYRDALNKIATMGANLRKDLIDWTNIGKNAVFTAKEALLEKCKKCGK